MLPNIVTVQLSLKQGTNIQTVLTEQLGTTWEFNPNNPVLVAWNPLPSHLFNKK